MSRYVYLVRFRSVLVKVGYSAKMVPSRQISRYKTYYPDFSLLAYAHKTPKEFERYLKEQLSSYNIDGELFEPASFDTAVKLCERECNLIMDHRVAKPNNDFLL